MDQPRFDVRLPVTLALTLAGALVLLAIGAQTAHGDEDTWDAETDLWDSDVVDTGAWDTDPWVPVEDTDPADTDPADTDPADTDPADTDPADTADPGSADPPDTDTGSPSAAEGAGESGGLHCASLPLHGGPLGLLTVLLGLALVRRRT
jgi:hypothetical protein